MSVALAVRKHSGDSFVLLVRRPESDDEFPGMWGLPAASCREGEGVMEAAKRIAVQKLGTSVELGRTLGTGSQERESYVLKMNLLEAHLENSVDDITLPSGSDHVASSVTMYTDFRWGLASELNDSVAGGSLCSQLLLRGDL